LGISSVGTPENGLISEKTGLYNTTRRGSFVKTRVDKNFLVRKMKNFIHERMLISEFIMANMRFRTNVIVLFMDTFIGQCFDAEHSESYIAHREFPWVWKRFALGDSQVCTSAWTMDILPHTGVFQ
jgi:hypothetical protein